MNARSPGSISARGSTSSLWAALPPSQAGIRFFFVFNASRARFRLTCQSSISSRYISHTQCTHPLQIGQQVPPKRNEARLFGGEGGLYDMQQLSGSSGRGGTLIPSTIRIIPGSGGGLAAGPANLEPKIIPPTGVGGLPAPVVLPDSSSIRAAISACCSRSSLSSSAFSGNGVWTCPSPMGCWIDTIPLSEWEPDNTGERTIVEAVMGFSF